MKDNSILADVGFRVIQAWIDAHADAEGDDLYYEVDINGGDIVEVISEIINEELNL